MRLLKTMNKLPLFPPCINIDRSVDRKNPIDMKQHAIACAILDFAENYQIRLLKAMEMYENAEPIENVEDIEATLLKTFEK